MLSIDLNWMPSCCSALALVIAHFLCDDTRNACVNSVALAAYYFRLFELQLLLQWQLCYAAITVCGCGCCWHFHFKSCGYVPQYVAYKIYTFSLGHTLLYRRCKSSATRFWLCPSHLSCLFLDRTCYLITNGKLANITY